MSFLNRASRRALKHFRKAPELSALVTQHALIDELVLDDFRRDAPTFNATLAEPFTLADGTDFEPSHDAKRDLFLSNFTAQAPGVLPADEIKPSRTLVRQVIEQIQHNEHHLATRVHTRMDRTNSAVVTTHEAEELEAALHENEASEAAAKSNEAQQAEQDLQDLQEQLDALREQAKDLTERGFPIPEHLPGEIKALTGKREEAAQALSDVAGTMDANMPAVAVAIADRAAQQGEKVAEVWTSLPGNEPGKRCRMNPDVAIKLSHVWMDSEHLRETAVLIGRLNRSFRAAVSKSIKGRPGRIVGIKRGNDLSNVLPSELVRLGHPLLRKTFLRDFADEQLLQYETVGTERANQGPGIFAADLSQSMMRPKDERGNYTLGRWRFAVAATIAFVRTMHRDGRDAIVILYTTTVVAEYEFPYRKPIDLEVLTDLASQAPHGGTDITQAMRRAADIIDAVPEFERADVVLLTDGADQWHADDEAIRERLHEKGVRIHGVLVHGATTTDYTRQMCGEEISIADLTAPSEGTTKLAQAVSA